MSGSKVRMWKQDPSVTQLGIRTAYIPTDVENGPKDQDIVIEGMGNIIKDEDGDFLYDPILSPIEFDAIHTYTVVRQVITMYRRALNRNSITQNFNWQWGPDPIKVYPRAGVEPNAYYSRMEQALRFFYFYPTGDETEPAVYTNRSYDIVAHEVGHAILDSLRPNYWNSWHPQTGGLHESFGDLTAIFMILSQMDQCEAVIAESKGDLHNKSFFPAMAEQFGGALGREAGLRHADNDLKLSEVSNEVHDISKVFTGAIYDILADIYEDYHNPSLYHQAESLFRVGKHMTDLVIMSLLASPEQNATYNDIAQKIISFEANENWKQIIYDQFGRREVFDNVQFLAAEKPQKLDWSRCCGTLRQKDHTKRVEQAMAKRRTAHGN